MALKCLAQYESELPPISPPEKSGIECPDCERELIWMDRSLICINPAMRRLLCQGCGFSKVVRVIE